MKKRFESLKKSAQKHWKQFEKDARKGEHNVPIFLAVIVLLLLFSGVRIIQLDNRNDQLVSQQRRLIEQVDSLAGVQDTIAEQLSLIVTSSQSELLTLREQTEERLALAREEIENARLNLEDKIESQGSALRTVIRTWEPRVPLIECTFSKTDSNGTPSFSSTTGAGTLFNFQGEDIILTNKHVLEEDNKKLETCNAIFSDAEDEYVFTSGQVALSSNLELDSGRVILNEETPGYVMSRLADSSQICAERATIGDEIVILGYPSIGSEDSITATEGIISGFEDDFYITSAKVERGNSGGAAILVRENCYLGIPTFTAAGRVESLARILDVGTI